MTATQKFTKVERGWYATADGKYAVVVDGYEPSQSVGADRSGYEGFQGGEWALVHDPRGNLREDHNGTNLDWFSTKREAVAAGEREQERRG